MIRKNGSVNQVLEVTALTSKTRQTIHRNGVSDALVQWHRQKSPPPSIDVLLARPIDAITMALCVATSLGRIDKPIVAELQRVIKTWRVEHAETIVVINEICGRAMNDRKRGLFKTNGRRQSAGRTPR